MKKAPFKSRKNFWATGAEHWVHDFFLRATNGRPYKGLGVRTQSAASADQPPSKTVFVGGGYSGRRPAGLKPSTSPRWIAPNRR